MAVAMVLLLVCGNLTRISARADFDSVNSKGNYVFDSGEVSFNAADMDHLQSEVTTLYGELPSVIGAEASALGKARRDDIQSKGIINYNSDTVIFDSADFITLANEIDNLESEYKANVVAALSDIDTYFNIDGSIAHNQGEETVPAEYAAGLDLDLICTAIRQSQSVDHMEAAPAAANNISAGTAAWVNGECIIGNGDDVKEAYEQGYAKGKNDGYEEGYAKGKNDGYEQGYAKGKSDGYSSGVSDGEQNVRNNPGSFGLSTGSYDITLQVRHDFKNSSGAKQTDYACIYTITMRNGQITSVTERPYNGNTRTFPEGKYTITFESYDPAVSEVK